MTRDRMRQSIKGRALCRAFSSRSAGGVIFKVVLKSLQERKKRISSEISSTIYFYMLCIPYLIFFLKISILVFLVFYRIVLPIVQMFSLLTCCSFLITLPPEVQDPQALAHLEGLNFYLSLYEQDPEWVAFIQQELNHNTPLEDIPGRLRLFLMEERTSNVRMDLIQEFLALYARNGAVLPVEPYLLEGALRSYLDSIRATDDFSILQAAYQDLRDHEEGSFFFRDVVSHNRDFLEAQSAKRTWIEVERNSLYSKIERAQARLERTEFQHTLLIFQLEDRKRGGNNMPYTTFFFKSKHM
ncbi:hypothetical protein DAI22_12g148850 [Oryza sativa Japonica Group]|nr:uncharacterized protein LOC107279571 [Oryza sativa Japonica Group]KAF2908074.1 hypothetical protein DAI22_12g148850 [Oryza sativa Japonica Group]